MLSVEYGFLYPAQVGGLFDPAAVTEVIEKFRASTGPLSENVHHFTFGTDAAFGNPEDFPDVLEAIKQQFPFDDYIPPGKFPLSTSLYLVRVALSGSPTDYAKAKGFSHPGIETAISERMDSDAKFLHPAGRKTGPHARSRCGNPKSLSVLA